MAQTVFTHNGFPKVGIRPIIDGRRRGVRESLEVQTMDMAKAAAKLISDNLRYPDGSKVECVIADTTIGGRFEAAMCANKFRDNNVGVSLSVTPCWCYGTETMDLDPQMPKAVWGFNGTERPGAVYLACMLAGYAQRGMPAYGIYGHEVQNRDESSKIPADVAEKILRFAKAGLAVAMMKGKSYLSIGTSAMGIAGSFVDVNFMQDYLGIAPENMDECEILRRIEEGIYDKEEYKKAIAWMRKNLKEGKDYNPAKIQKSRAEKDKDWEFIAKMAIIVRDMMAGNPKLKEMGFGEEAVGRNAIAERDRRRLPGPAPVDRPLAERRRRRGHVQHFVRLERQEDAADPRDGERLAQRHLHASHVAPHQQGVDVRRRSHVLERRGRQARDGQGASEGREGGDHPPPQLGFLLPRRGGRDEGEGEAGVQELVGCHPEGHRRHLEGDEVGSGGSRILPRRRLLVVVPYA